MPPVPHCREYTLGLTIQRDECACATCLGDDTVDSCGCGCVVCLSKACAEKTIVCDECGKNYHYYCLDSVVRDTFPLLPSASVSPAFDY